MNLYAIYPIIIVAAKKSDKTTAAIKLMNCCSLIHNESQNIKVRKIHCKELV